MNVFEELAGPARTVRALWPFLWPERRHLALVVAVTALLTGVEVALPLLAGRVVDTVLAGAGAVPGTAGAPVAPGGPVARVAGAGAEWTRHALVGVLVAGALVRGTLVAWQRALRGQVGEAVAARLRLTLWRHVQELPIDYVRRRGAGRMAMRFVGDVRAVQRLVANGLVQVGQDVVLIIAVAIGLCFLSWRMGAAVAAALPLFGALFWLLNPRLRRASRSARKRRGRLSAYVSDRLAGLVALKAAGRQSAESGHVHVLTQKLAERGARFAAISGQQLGYGAAALAAGSALLLEVAAGEISARRLSGGNLVAFYALLGLLLAAFQRLVTANQYFQLAQVAVDRLLNTLSQRPESFGDDVLPDLAVPAGRIVVAGVSYAYDEDQPALQQICLGAARGELMAIVGANGAGKSTLLELLLRLRQPTQGRVLIDGQDVARVNLASLRRQVGYVPQQPEVLDGTVYDNVAYGLPPLADGPGAESGAESGATAPDEASDTRPFEPDPRVLRAARLTGVDALVATLTEGWQTRVGQGGYALSGGQRQRIALARATVHDPPILVLDEATGAVDPESELTLAHALRALARHKTVIVATHRPTTLSLADRIYVLDAGRMVETGDHEALVGRGGRYARLFGAAPDVARPTATPTPEARPMEERRMEVRQWQHEGSPLA